MIMINKVKMNRNNNKSSKKIYKQIKNQHPLCLQKRETYNKILKFEVKKIKYYKVSFVNQ